MSEPNPEAGAAGTPYAVLGGSPGVRALVDDFYRRVVGDPRLAAFFDGVDLARLKRHQVLVIGEVLGGPGGYDGAGLRAGHAGLGITPADYALVGGHLIATFTDAGAAPQVLAAVRDTLGAVEPQIVTRPDEPEGAGGTEG